MAKVGQVLTEPEAGWKRIDDRDPNITYTGSLLQGTYPNMYLSTFSELNSVGSTIRFNFIGTAFRFIGMHHPDKTSSADIFLDGVNVARITQFSSDITTTVIDYNVENLVNTEHSISIVNNTTNYLCLDAVDIDANGELKPYSPINTPPTPTPTGNVLLRITMVDSSEREYRLSSVEVDGFVNWYTRTIGTGISCYALNDIIDGSKEYLSFEKIISFKVIPLAK